MLHFSDKEFDRRQKSLEKTLEAAGLDGILLFSPESQYWLTGYDTFGFCFFQCLIVGGDEPVLLTRSADKLQAEITSNISDIRIWIDNDQANPAVDLKNLLKDKQLLGKRLGIETDTHGLTAFNYKRTIDQLGDKVDLVEASDLISKLRLIKSEEELTYVKRAATLADDAFDAAVSIAAPGVDEGKILAGMHEAIFSGGGDYPGNEFIIGSAENALLVRYAAGTRKLSANDQLNLEWAGVYRHYHSCLMRTLLVGKTSQQHKDMFEAGVSALLACEEKLKPGNNMEQVFMAHCDTLDRLGMGEFKLNACGYSLGARYTPTWMEREMFRAGAVTEIKPGMVFFLHMILLDGNNKVAMCTGRTSIVLEAGSTPLSRLPLKLVTV